MGNRWCVMGCPLVLVRSRTSHLYLLLSNISNSRRKREIAREMRDEEERRREEGKKRYNQAQADGGCEWRPVENLAQTNRPFPYFL